MSYEGLIIGVTFEGFTPHLGYRVCSGERYDNLLSQYGSDDPATSFAIDLEVLLEALENSQPIPVQAAADCLLIDFCPDKRQVLQISRQLRACGPRIARDIIFRRLEGSLSYAHQSGISYGLIMGAESLPTGQAIFHDVHHGHDIPIAIDATVTYVDQILRRQASKSEQG